MVESCRFYDRRTQGQTATGGARTVNAFSSFRRGHPSPASLPVMRLLIASFMTTTVTLAAGGATDRSDPTDKRMDRQNGARVVHFPRERSIGRLMIDVGKIADPFALSSPDRYYGWEYFGEAQGEVSVPAGKRLRLHVARAAMKNLSALKKLGPNDLYMLTITGLPGEPANPDKTVMPYVAGLTGLEELDLQVVCIGPEGFRHIKDLQSLKSVYIKTDKSVSDGLVHLEGLRSLEILFLGARYSDASLSHLSKLTSLQKLSLNVTEVRGPGLVHLDKLPGLKSLQLMGTGFGDDGLAYIRNMTSLKELSLLGGLTITDAGLAHLSQLKNLENLDCHWMKGITDQGMAHLKPMRSLKKLDITHSQVTDAGLAYLKEIESLESLELPHHGITDKGLGCLSGLTKLKHLSVGLSSASPITDAGLGHLVKLRLLEKLDIIGTGITDMGMSHIATMPNLKSLAIGLEAGQVTNDGLAKLATLKSLEGLTVFIHPPLSGKKTGRSNITVSGLSHLNGLPGLKRLRVTSLRQDNTGLDLSKLSQLESLMLDTEKGSAIHDEDLACLSNMKRLRNLQIPDGAVTDAGMAHLAGLTSMERLVIGCPDLTDKGVEQLANMRRLYCLVIEGNITDKGLQHLEKLKGMRILEIRPQHDFSRAALNRLRTKLPNLQIFNTDGYGQTHKTKNRPAADRSAAPTT